MIGASRRSTSELQDNGAWFRFRLLKRQIQTEALPAVETALSLRALRDMLTCFTLSRFPA